MITEPVKVLEPIVESDRESVFRLESVPVFYRVEAVCPDGTTKILENIRKYTKQLRLDEKVGRIEIEIAWEENKKERKLVIPYPYHHLHAGKVLCALKMYDMHMHSSDEEGVRGFGLNYNLFNLPWQLCVILHAVDGKVSSFVTSRMEWDRGNISAENQEVQMFLRVPIERHAPVSLMKLMVDPSVALWMDHCEAEIRRKNWRM